MSSCQRRARKGRRERPRRKGENTAPPARVNRWLSVHGLVRRGEPRVPASCEPVCPIGVTSGGVLGRFASAPLSSDARDHLSKSRRIHKLGNAHPPRAAVAGGGTLQFRIRLTCRSRVPACAYRIEADRRVGSLRIDTARGHRGAKAPEYCDRAYDWAKPTSLELTAQSFSWTDSSRE